MNIDEILKQIKSELNQLFADNFKNFISRI